MTDAKSPERIWADVIVWGDMEPLAGEWNCRDVGRTEDTEYVRKDLYDAIAKERDELAAELDSMVAIKDIHQNKRHEYFERAEKAEAEVELLRKALHVFASAADGRRRKDWFGGMCFQQDVLLEARAALQRKEGNE